jgi:hypothetical protein
VRGKSHPLVSLTANSALLWKGQSKLARTNAPIALIATGFTRMSKNSKTGPMLQTSIIRTDQHPVDVRRTGVDRSICGDCPLSNNRGCHVRVEQAPAAWFRILESMPEVNPVDVFQWLTAKRLPLRVAYYGDPAAVPVSLWRQLVPEPSRRMHTAYTHQWRKSRYRYLRDFCMASTESREATHQAWDQGWRTFRIREVGSPLLRGELDCPASKAKGPDAKTCAQCRLCFGRHPSAKSISIEAHGGASVMRKVNSLVGTQAVSPTSVQEVRAHVS